MRWILLLLFTLGTSLPATAGFMDNVINKAKKITEDTVTSTVKTFTGDKSEEHEKTTQSKPKSVPAQFKDGRELGGLAFQATVHYHPEVLDDESWLKRAANTLYPDESKSFQNNEFAWQKNKADIKSRVRKQITNPILTIRLSPWTNPNGGRFVLGNYDFNRKAFSIRLAKIQPVGIGDMRSYWQNLSKAISEIGWVSVPPDIAEKLAQSKGFSGKRTLYADYEYTFTGANKSNNKGKINLVSIINLKEVKLYYLTKAYAENGAEDFEYITTLILPDFMAQKTEPPPEKKKSSKPVAQTTAPKQLPIVKTPQPIPQKRPEPIVELGPYARVEKGSPYGPDMVGLKLGMSLEEADNLIRQHKIPIDVVNGNAPEPFVNVRGYVLEPGDESVTILTLASPIGERIAGFVRYVYFDPEKSPAQVAVVSSLEKKYGKASYTYETKGSFERRWFTNSKGEYVPTDQFGVPQGIGKCERAAYLSSGSTVFSGQKPGYQYLWNLPWFMERPAGNLWFLKPGNPNRIKHPNRCGSTLVSKYSDGSGMLTGATLSFVLFDSAWIIEAINKKNKTDAKQGVKGLDL